MKLFFSKQNTQHSEVIKINLSNEQLITLVEVLISTVSKLNNENDYQRYILESHRSKIEELKIENMKLKDDKTVTYNIDKVTPF